MAGGTVSGSHRGLDGRHKDRFDIWRSRQFLDYLERVEPDGFVIAGVELACCILYAVLGADEMGYRYSVPQDLVSGIDPGGQTYNRAVRDYLRHFRDAPENRGRNLRACSAARTPMTPGPDDAKTDS